MPHLDDPEWERSRKRFAAWWVGEVEDRVLLQVTAPRPAAASPPAAAISLEQQWLDADWRMRAFEHQMSATHYGGDAFPYLETHIGPGTMSLYLGAQPELRPDTVWYGKCIEDIRAAEPPERDDNNPYWTFSRELASQAAVRLKGRALVALPDLIEGLDILASLVGTDKLLLYLVDAPDDVHRFQASLTESYFDFHEPLYNIVCDEHEGCCFSAFSTYAPSAMAKVQCDFSAMLSPAMFEEFVAPYLDEQCERLDYAVYHLDGPCCLQHLDILLSLPNIDAIQWTPGASEPHACWEGWVPLYRKIRKAGKSVMIRGGTPDCARKIVEELGPEGLDIMLWVQTPDEADSVVRQSFQWKKR